MNQSRRDWSGIYKCYKDKRNSLTAFYSLATTIFIIVISFYFAVYYIGTRYPPSETLDEREISQNIRTYRQRNEINQQPGPSSSTPITRTTNPRKLLSINQDDSDDEILTENIPVSPQNLIALN